MKKVNLLIHSNILLVILIFLFTSKTVQASHFAGSDLTYTCLGGNTYLITYSFYRDCSGISEPSNVTVQFNCSSNSSFNFSAILYKIPGTGNQITIPCGTVLTSCIGGTGFGIEEYIYQAQVTMAPCNYWTLSTGGCCRNNGITTVPGNNSNHWTSIAKLNNLNAPCNSSPTFTNKPVVIICAFQQFSINHGAVDPDGDSLVYSFYPVFTTNTNTTVTYASPWSYTNFLTALTPPGLTIDSATGDINFTATQILTSIFGVKVEEYRNINGVTTLIGTVYRDLEIHMVSCNNNHIPTLSGMDFNQTHTYNPNDTTYSITKCLGNNPIEFDINGFDIDTFNPSFSGHPERYSISWNNGIPNANFTTHYNGSDSAYAHFSWLPTAADIGNLKCFTATVQDEACPYNGAQTFSYCILVRGMTVEIGSDTLLCEGENLMIHAIADSNTINYIWSINGNTTNTPQFQNWYLIDSKTLGPGKHNLSIQTNDGNTNLVCPGQDQITIDIIYQPHINGSLMDSAFCEGSSITYNAGQGKQYLWSDIANNPLGTKQSFTFVKSGLYTVRVNGGINTRCFDVDTFEIVSIPNPKLRPDTCLWETDAPYMLEGGSFQTNLLNTWQDNSHTQTYQVIKSGIFSLTYSHKYISPSLGCSDTTVINIINRDEMIVSAKLQNMTNIEIEDYQPGNREICTKQKLRIKGITSESKHPYSYTWSLNDKFLGNKSSFIFKEVIEGTYFLKLDIANGCTLRIEVKTKACNIFVPNVFTPKNIDGINDFFKIEMIGKDGKPNGEPFYLYFPKSTLLIHNRWGNKIFESNDYHNDWNGNDAADGIYYWTLELEDGEGTQMNGTVTIISK